MIECIQNYLNIALERLFKNKDEIGFWDDTENRILECIYHDEKWNWKYKSSNKHRYSLFCLGMLLLSKEIYHLNTDKYNYKIKKYLKKIKINVQSFSSSDLTYGALLSLILGEKIYNLRLITEKTKLLLLENIKRLLKTTDNHDFLLLIAAYYFNQIYPSKKTEGLIKKIQIRLLNSLNSFYFETGDIRAVYHQRVMYTLWGLIFSSSFSNYEKIKTISRDLIDYFYNNRRFNDNAFLWHPALYFVKFHGIKIPVYNRRSSKYLYECHQTFFANSINIYRYLFNENRAFDKEKHDAIEWIFGKNRNGKNLVNLTGISLPNRVMNLDGNYFVPNGNFKGSYEVGSYVFALSSF